MYRKKSQAVVEMGLFSGVLLVMLMAGIVAMLYVHDEAALSMESFRRALGEAGPKVNDRGYSVTYAELMSNRYRQFQSKSAPLNRFYGSAEVYWIVPSIKDLETLSSGSVQGGRNKVVYKVNEDRFNNRRYVREAQDTNRIIDKNWWVTIDSFFQWVRENAIVDKSGVSFRQKKEKVRDILVTSFTDDQGWFGTIQQQVALTMSKYGAREKEVYKIYDERKETQLIYDINEQGTITKTVRGEVKY